MKARFVSEVACPRYLVDCDVQPTAGYCGGLIDLASCERLYLDNRSECLERAKEELWRQRTREENQRWIEGEFSPPSNR